MVPHNINSCVMVIFGGTGDLTHRKLLPAIYSLKHQDMLEQDIEIVAVGRRDKTSEEYRNEAENSVRRFCRFELDEARWSELKERLHYFKAEFNNDEGYKGLKEFLEGLDKTRGTKGNRLYYLAVSPGNYELIISKLQDNGLTEKTEAWKRIVIEKPFGRDLDSARLLNRRISQVFPEESTYRIDHYLGKEMVQSILGIRFANAIFEPLWSNKYIDNIQISSSEIIGIESRGEYYDKTGALGDMVQNHILQILALVAMEPPGDMEPESIRNEKTKLLQSIIDMPFGSDEKDIVFGQYSKGVAEDKYVVGYREEAKVVPTSETETFVALKLHIDNPRWENTPVYIRTGKRLATRSTEVIIQFKPTFNSLFQQSDSRSPEPNLLVIKIQPQEQLYIRFNTKEPGISGKICPVKMNFCQNCRVCEAKNCSPDAYEKLIHDAIKGDSTLFTRWDEVEQSWKFIDKVMEIKKHTTLSFPNYVPGSWGPVEADLLLKRDNRKWWNLEED